jgi:HPt (histidine-containing phosphotransfer) domain-containing protein
MTSIPQTPDDIFNAPHSGGSLAAPPTLDTMDWGELSARCLGNAALIRRVVDAFHQCLDQELQQLYDASQRRDDVQLAHVAHRLKGSAANLGARRIEREAAEIERLAREQAWQQVTDHLARLPDERQLWNAAVDARFPPSGH